ncbi:phosphonate ABC transporter ATP-binding protein [Caulobacter sp. BK020]|uniref:phosphonate ABC transporter ATP-binding protein n=1 Tax=Caulobacter sp. BK020 TaxID=2512117 RepID=UPI001051AE58|nr:phosphonate ABC transporter ATP-binding protein [Caulobacter sp. BK020]TCS13305.1 phosphonate transport system ATP-binding protein [Caulobacter sp. BK020]
MTSDPVLSIRAASKTFGSRRALDAVSLDVGRGEMIALIGPSGSGKSTLLRSIDGLQTVDAPPEGNAGDGVITAFGGPVQARGKVSDQVRKARIRIGFIAQQFNLVGRLTLFTNVALGSLGRIGTLRGLFGAWPAETKAAAMAALHRVGVADYAAQRANTLSGGQQQRGAIARALVQKAKIILADEPVASLDPVSARKVMEILRDLNKTDGLTVVVTLHQVDYALRYCDRVVALKAGRKVYDGPTAGLDRAKLIDIYGPEFEDVFWEGAPQ